MKKYNNGGNYKNQNNKKYAYRHSNRYDDVWLREQPFYKAGMSRKQIDEEINYLNDNLDSFFEGRYIPLWKQSVYNMWFK